jgi:hypothetical protein
VGVEVVQQKFEAGLTGFVTGNPWLKLVHHSGPEGLIEAYGAVVEGRTSPKDGCIITP